MKLQISLLIFLLLVACSTAVEREARVERIHETKSWYCGDGMMGIRAIARYTIAAFTAVRVPDMCKVVDIIVIKNQ